MGTLITPDHPPRLQNRCTWDIFSNDPFLLGWLMSIIHWLQKQITMSINDVNGTWLIYLCIPYRIWKSSLTQQLLHLCVTWDISNGQILLAFDATAPWIGISSPIPSIAKLLLHWTICMPCHFGTQHIELQQMEAGVKFQGICVVVRRKLVGDWLLLMTRCIWNIARYNEHKEVGIAICGISDKQKMIWICVWIGVCIKVLIWIWICISRLFECVECV